MKECLLIIPRHFYSFETHIREALAKLNYNVTVANDEYPEGGVGKVLAKLQIPIIFQLTYNYIEKHYLNGKKYDLALIFKGRGISQQLIERMQESAKCVVGYNWDSFKLNRAPLKWYKSATKYYTFDYRDAERYSLPVLELFTSSPIISDEKNLKYDISAIVRNHSSRLRYVDKVLSILKPSNPYLYIYEQNLIFFLLNFVKNPHLFIKYWKYIHFKPLSYRDYSEVIKLSEFTIDYAHYTQTGITMRCYEAINMNTKIITNNKYIKKSNHFNDSNCVVFFMNDAPEELINSYNSCKEKRLIAKARNIMDFIKEIVA